MSEEAKEKIRTAAKLREQRKKEIKAMTGYSRIGRNNI